MMSPEFATLLAGIGGGVVGGSVGAGASFFFNHRWSLYRDARKTHLEYLALIRRVQAECESLTLSLDVIKNESLDAMQIPVKRLPLTVLSTARLAPATTPKAIKFHKLLSPVEVNLALFNQLLELSSSGSEYAALSKLAHTNLNSTLAGVQISLEELRKECVDQILLLEQNVPKLSCFLPPCDCI